jgi:hypothetical protein
MLAWIQTESSEDGLAAKDQRVVENVFSASPLTHQVTVIALCKMAQDGGKLLWCARPPSRAHLNLRLDLPPVMQRA